MKQIIISIFIGIALVELVPMIEQAPTDISRGLLGGGLSFLIIILLAYLADANNKQER
jgi:hypothetical protein